MPTDPTRSTTKRKRVERRLHRYWTGLRGDVRRELTGDSYYRPQNDVSIGRQTAEFREWLESTITESVVEPVYTTRQLERGEHWTGPIVREFYEHGLSLAHADLIDAGVPEDHPAVNVPTDAILRNDTPRFGGDGIHTEYLIENYDEIYHDIEDAARETTKQAYREYRDAVRTGATVAETIDRVNDRIEKVGSTRTDLVARTKLVQVINDAILARYEELAENPSELRVGVDIEKSTPDDSRDGPQKVATDGGVSTATHSHESVAHAHGSTAARDGVESVGTPIEYHAEAGETVRQVFETAGDRRVCQSCEVYEGAIYTLAEIWSGATPRPPLHPNCRCRYRLFSIADLGWT